MLKSNVSEPNDLSEVEVLQDKLKINGKEINGITNLKVVYDGNAKLVKVNVEFIAKCVR
ncbi:hypothetical protein [Clostridium thermobutyricum]|uniref:hypothetical protein n=1 Tax=Clostridium thermobutyricum TaxID=29372 RepID=UPI002943DB2B|nr:hypothetical protein [Clostridium thermobutyricum]